MAKVKRYEAGWNLDARAGRVVLELDDGKRQLLRTVDPAVFQVVLTLLAKGDARVVNSPSGPWIASGDASDDAADDATFR